MKSEMPKNSPVVFVLIGILSLLPLPLAAQQISRTALLTGRNHHVNNAGAKALT